MVVYMRNCFKASILDNLSTTTDANSQQLWLKVQMNVEKRNLLYYALLTGQTLCLCLDSWTISLPLLWIRFF